MTTATALDVDVVPHVEQLLLKRQQVFLDGVLAEMQGASPEARRDDAAADLAVLEDLANGLLSANSAFAAALAREVADGESAHHRSNQAAAAEERLAECLKLLCGPDPDAVRNILKFTDRAFESGLGDYGQSVAFTMQSSRLTKEIGHLAFGSIASRRQLWEFAADCFDLCSAETLAQYQLMNAVTAYTRMRRPRVDEMIRHAAGLVSDGSLRMPLDDAISLAAFAAARADVSSLETFLIYATAHELSQFQAFKCRNIKACFQEQAAAARARSAESSSYHTLFDTVTTSGHYPRLNEQDMLQIGVFRYSNPTYPSNNIGDYVQTLAVIGQLTRADCPDLDAPEFVRGLFQGAAKEPSLRASRKVHITAVDRDFSVAQANLGPIWLPVCGWFQHECYFTEYCFPFADNIFPTFLSFHLARHELLTDRAIAYLRRYAPIGCRDMNTVRLLRDVGVPAFFNGCVTLTLRRLFPAFDGERQGHYLGAYRAAQDASAQSSYATVAHAEFRTFTSSLEANLESAAAILQRYRMAEHVKTPLLHCYLPCRSMQTPVEFTHKQQSDMRFEGLIGLSDDAIAHRVGAFERLFAGIYEHVLKGASPEDIMQRWRELCAEPMAQTDALLQDAAARRGPPPAQLDVAKVEAVVPTVWNAAAADAAGAAPLLDLVFCFDEPFFEYFAPTFESIFVNTKAPLRANIVGRNITDAHIAQLAELWPGVVWRLFDLTGFSYGAVKLLSHISVSTMDRLMVPLLLRDIDHAVYLDVDILVRGDVAELAGIDLGGHALGSRDSIHKEWKTGYALVYGIAGRFAPELASEFRNFLHGTGKVRFTAFNAGVLVMNLKRMRDDKMAESLYDLVLRYGVHDQIALNVYTRENRANIGAAWNHFATQEILKDPKLVHFIGETKPWDKAKYHAWSEVWRAHKENVEARRKKA